MRKMSSTPFILFIINTNFRQMYTCRDCDKPKYCVELSSHAVGLVRVGKTVVVGCSDQTLQGFTQKVLTTAFALPIIIKYDNLLP